LVDHLLLSPHLTVHPDSRASLQETLINGYPGHNQHSITKPRFTNASIFNALQASNMPATYLMPNRG